MSTTTEDRVTPNGIEPLPVMIPVAAPVHVGAAALALAYAIEAMYRGPDVCVTEADNCITFYRQIMDDAGWRLSGVHPVDRTWKVVPR